MNLRFWQRAKQEKELDDEIQSHLRMAAQERIEAGHNPRDAEAEARRELGNEGLIKDTTREVWGLGWIERLVQDLRYGFRVLWKSPVYALVALFTLALGIGANTAIFSVVYGVLLRSLPFKDPSRLVVLNETTPKVGPVSVSYPNFLDWRAQSHAFLEMAAVHGLDFNLGGIKEPENLDGLAVSSNFLSTLGVQPVFGRDFDPSEENAGT